MAAIEVKAGRAVIFDNKRLTHALEGPSSSLRALLGPMTFNKGTFTPVGDVAELPFCSTFRALFIDIPEVGKRRSNVVLQDVELVAPVPTLQVRTGIDDVTFTAGLSGSQSPLCEPSAPVKSVNISLYRLDDSSNEILISSRVENVIPYTLYGNTDHGYKASTSDLLVGLYIIDVKYFSEYGARGNSVQDGPGNGILFRVVEATSAPTPRPTPAPTPTPTSIPTFSPTPLTPSPTSSPTSAPTFSPTVPLCEGLPRSAFESIASTGQSLISTCDDCAAEVKLSFGFPWLSGTIVQTIVVSSNGQINLDALIFDQVYGLDAIGNFETGERIAVAQARLSPSAGGAIFVLDKGTSVIISYEDVTFSADPPIGALNAQVELYDTGAVEIRWGTGVTENRRIAAGIESPAASLAFPVTSVTNAAFGPDGVTRDGLWPQNDGVLFESNCLFTPTIEGPRRDLISSGACFDDGCFVEATFRLTEGLEELVSATLTVEWTGDIGDPGETADLRLNEQFILTCTSSIVDDCNIREFRTCNCIREFQTCSTTDVLGAVVASGGLLAVSLDAAGSVDRLCGDPGFFDYVIRARFTLSIECTYGATVTGCVGTSAPTSIIF